MEWEGVAAVPVDEVLCEALVVAADGREDLRAGGLNKEFGHEIYDTHPTVGENDPEEAEAAAATPALLPVVGELPVVGDVTLTQLVLATERQSQKGKD